LPNIYQDLLSAVTKLDLHPIKHWNQDVAELVHAAPKLYRLTINATAFKTYRSEFSLWKPSITQVIIRESVHYEEMHDCVAVFLDAVEHLPNLTRVSSVDRLSISQSLDLTIEEECVVGVSHQAIYRFGDWANLQAALNSIDGAADTATRYRLRLQLREVSAHRAPYISDQEISQVARNHRSLRVLTVRAEHLKGDVMFALAEHCPQLQVLSLGCGESFTDAAVVRLAQGCTDLRELTLNTKSIFYRTEGPLLTDAALVGLSTYCPRLEKVDLTRCRLLTDAGVAALASGCPHLVSVTLTSCVLLTDAAIVALAQGCRGLHALHMAGCPLLTDAALVALSQHCPQLRVLVTTARKKRTDTPGITHAGIDALRLELPLLKATQIKIK
jgi:hypothetical protein